MFSRGFLLLVIKTVIYCIAICHTEKGKKDTNKFSILPLGWESFEDPFFSLYYYVKKGVQINIRFLPLFEEFPQLVGTKEEFVRIKMKVGVLFFLKNIYSNQ